MSLIEKLAVELGQSTEAIWDSLVKQAEMDLESKKKELNIVEAVAKTIKEREHPTVGDYVEVTTTKGEVFIGKLFKTELTYSIAGCDNKDIYCIKKWQPKKGDLCIFGDFGEEGNAVIGIFLEENNDNYPEYRFETTMGPYKYCIPFLSEKQYKEHIGYE